MSSTNFTFNGRLSPQELKVRDLVRSLLIVLSDKEKFIITNRFALENPKRLTLEEIGQHFGVTRERVRQIEQTALRKLERNAQNTNVRILTEFAKALLSKEGMVVSDERFKSLLLKILPNITESEIQDLHLALNLDSEITFEPNTLHFHPYWKMNGFDGNLVQKISALAIKHLQKTKRVISEDDMASFVNESLKLNLQKSSIINAIAITKECKFTESGIGLYSWRHIHPRTLKDKIFYIFQREKKPLHFEKIAEHISSLEFDRKKINVQAVHNELIRNNSFILIGRGIYALSDWGYKTGTVSEVIVEVLKDGKARTREEITKAVLAQRHVKTITIYLNLKNKDIFARVGRDKYTLKEFV